MIKNLAKISIFTHNYTLKELKSKILQFTNLNFDILVNIITNLPWIKFVRNKKINNINTREVQRSEDNIFKKEFQCSQCFMCVCVYVYALKTIAMYILI